MIQFIIPILRTYFSSGMARFWFYIVIALAFTATVPCIIRKFVR